MTARGLSEFFVNDHNSPAFTAVLDREGSTYWVFPTSALTDTTPLLPTTCPICKTNLNFYGEHTNGKTRCNKGDSLWH